MQQVQGGDEELVGVLGKCRHFRRGVKISYFSLKNCLRYLLLVAGEVVGVGPDHVEQLVGGEGGFQTGEELLQEAGETLKSVAILVARSKVSECRGQLL